MTIDQFQIYINGEPIGLATSATLNIPPYSRESTERLSSDNVFEFDGPILAYTLEFKVFFKHLAKAPKRSITFMSFGKWAYAITSRTNTTRIDDKLFIHAKKGVYILPKDGSYVRFISNSWYE